MLEQRFMLRYYILREGLIFFSGSPHADTAATIASNGC